MGELKEVLETMIKGQNEEIMRKTELLRKFGKK
jgi:hypothetical protein